MQELNNADLDEPTKVSNDRAYKLQLFKHSNCDNVENYCDVNCLKTLFRPCPYVCSESYPICYSVDDQFHVDPFVDSIHAKEKLEKKLTHLKVVYDDNMKKVDSSKVYDCFHRVQKIFADNMDSRNSFDVADYYNGSNLDLQELLGGLSIFHVTNNSTLSISHLIHYDSNWRLISNAHISNDKDVIFQLATAIQNEQTVFVYVRGKRDISLYRARYDYTNQIKLEIIEKNENSIPFLTMNVNESNPNEYVTVDVKHNLKVWNQTKEMEKWGIKLPYRYEYSEIFFNNNRLAYINKDLFQIMNIGSPTVTATLSKSKCQLNDFDRFSNLCFSNEIEPYFYISTLKAILLIDIRTMSVVCRWPHTFTSPPYLSDYVRLNERNTLCISSHKPDEKLIIANQEVKNNNIQYTSVSPPSLMASFDSCLAKNPNEGLSVHIKDRLQTSTTGLRLIKDDDNIFSIFSANSLGDVFCHKVSDIKKPTQYNGEEFLEWNKQIVTKKRNEEQLNFTDKVILKELNLEDYTEPVDRVNVKKREQIDKCVLNLKTEEKGFSEKMDRLWHEDRKANNLLNRLKELPPRINVHNWLSNK